MQSESPYFISSKQTTLKLSKKARVVFSIFPAVNDTFVMFRGDKTFQKKSVVHVNAVGEILWERSYDNNLQQVFMRNQHEVLALNTEDCRVDIINLQTYNVIELQQPHFPKDEAPALYFFQQTSLLCFSYVPAFKEKALRLTYFSYADIQKQSEPIVQWEAPEYTCFNFRKFDKINNHSKFGWWTLRHNEDMVLVYFDLAEDPKGKLTEVKIKNPIPQAIDGKIYVQNSYLWQLNRNKYILVSFLSYEKEVKPVKAQICNNTYIIDCQEEQPVLRNANFSLGDGVEENDFAFDDCGSLGFLGVGDVSIFHIFRNRYSRTEPAQKLFYYVVNSTQQLIHKEQFKCRFLQFNVYAPGWNLPTFIQTIHEQANVKEATLYVKSFQLNLKSVYLNMLLHLNEDFDDDLLQDGLSLLVDL